MNFEELGSILRAEREKRNLSIDDAANELKINPRQLRALESGDAQALPHPAYVRGFIRSYASWLGLNNDEIMAALDKARQPPQEELTPRQEELYIPEPEPHSRKKGHGGVIGIIFFCLLAAGCYFAWRNGALEFLNQKYEEYTGASKNEITLSEDKKDATPPPLVREEPKTPVVAIAEPTRNEPQNQEIEKEEQQPIVVESQSVADNAAAETTPPEDNKESTVESSAPEQHKLIITALEECWIHSNADKTESRQFSLRKGDTFALTFGKTLELKLGNAGGVRLRYDGNDLPAPGTSGQVKTLVFPPKTGS